MHAVILTNNKIQDDPSYNKPFRPLNKCKVIIILEFLSGNLKTRNFFFPIKMHPFASSLFFLGNLRKKVLLPPGFELQTFLSTVLYLCLKTTESSYEIWGKVVFMNWSNNEHRKGCILMGKFFFQVFKLRDKNSSNHHNIVLYHCI